jgi:hypothetical protein
VGEEGGIVAVRLLHALFEKKMVWQSKERKDGKKEKLKQAGEK